ncbi:EIN3-binding F-box protein 1-like [Phoenix dactylifera]|uniref:EIN3-binding F-box protein 1-like n=1 Tax=Phoenix dactylifera TaxID=42345 RepID=A0A8B8ZIB4_PHODC|nr:EIN3-binding F-box protein 1-like [Phoenix dactylifera]
MNCVAGEAREVGRSNNMARGDGGKRVRCGTAEESRASGPDFINQLPEECLALIFGFLPLPRDRCSCALVSKKWLHVQACMRHSKLRSEQDEASLPSKEISRCLDMEEANDRRLAAMAIGIPYQGVLTELAIRASLPPLPFSSRGADLTDYGLTIISQACSNLKSLTLWNCTKIGNKGVASLANCCTSLEKFSLSNSPSITDDGLLLIAKGCPNLSSLILDSCPSVGNRWLEAFAKHSNKLKLFILERCPLVKDSAIISILTNLQELRMLKIGSMEIGDAVLEAVGRHAKQVRTLYLEKVRGVTEEGYCWIGFNGNLQSLSLNSCIGVTDKSFRKTSNGCIYLGLKKVAIKNCRSLTDSGLVELTRSAKSLKSITLENLDRITSRGLVEALSNCSRTLKELSLLKCNLMQSDTHPLPQHFPVLKAVTLNQCQGFGEGFLVRMGWACEQVEEIGLVRMDSITDGGILGFLYQLGGNTDVTKLDLSGCRFVTDRSLRAIAQRCQELEELDLSGCRISDQGVEWLASEGPSWLQALSLAGCAAITDKSLEALQTLCVSLESLNVTRCPGISREAISSFKEVCCFCDVRG